MQKPHSSSARGAIILSMCIFSTIGLLRRYINLPSGTIALSRAFIGSVFLLLLLLIRRRKPDFTALRKNALPLLLSGAALGFNWIALFESYRYTTVATATLCYYTAPILVILFSPLLFGERLTKRKCLCVLSAIVGIVLVSGVLQTGLSSLSELEGVLWGLGAAVLYATVVVLNKKTAGVDTMSRTICQLIISAVMLTVYTLFTEFPLSAPPTTQELWLLAVAGILHTGIAYALYFGAIGNLTAQTAALYSYLDPILAIILSAVLLHEPMELTAILGAVLILGAAIIADYPKKDPA